MSCFYRGAMIMPVYRPALTIEYMKLLV